jgi:hypothetical protein
LPELTDINYEQRFSSHNYLQKKMKIINLNEEKINKLTPEQLDKINSVFKRNVEILDYFNYQLID